jgi:hypothetical protein
MFNPFGVVFSLTLRISVCYMNIPAMSVLGIPTMVSTRDTGNYLY